MPCKEIRGRWKEDWEGTCSSEQQNLYHWCPSSVLYNGCLTTGECVSIITLVNQVNVPVVTSVYQVNVFVITCVNKVHIRFIIVADQVIVSYIAAVIQVNVSHNTGVNQVYVPLITNCTLDKCPYHNNKPGERPVNITVIIQAYITC